MTAHGKKLSKSKLMGISVQDICDEILHPEVPHSLRLQGILVGGVVVVFSKQLTYLLEDVQEMMRRVKDAINLACQGPSKATLKAGKDRAKPGAITLEEQEEAELRMLEAGNGEGAGLDLNNMLMDNMQNAHLNMLPLTQRLPGLTPADPFTQMEEADLFATSGLSGATVSRVDLEHRNQHRARVQQVQSKRAPVLLTNALDDELFEPMGDAGEELAFERELGFGADRSSELGSMSHKGHINDMAAEEERLNDMAALASDGKVAGGRSRGGMQALTCGSGSPEQVLRGDDQEEGMTSPASLVELEERRRRAAAVLRADIAAADEEVLATEEEGAARGGVLKKAAAATRQKKGDQVFRHKRGALLLDDPGNMLIKPKEFREWCVSTEDLVRPLASRGLKRSAGAADLTVDLMMTGYAGIGSGKPVASLLVFGAEAQYLGLQLCSPLFNLHSRMFSLPGAPNNASGQAPQVTTGKRGKKARLGDITTPAAAGGLARLLGGPAADAADEQLMEEEFMHQEHEQHDTLQELPFGGDVEVERLRAAPHATAERLRLANALTGSDLASSEAARLLALGVRPLMMNPSLSRQTSSALTGNTSSVQDGGLAMTGAHLLPPRARNGVLMHEGSASQDLLLPTDSPSTAGGPPLGARNRPHTGRTDASGDGVLLRWGQGLLEDLLPALEVHLPQMNIQLEDLKASESESEEPGSPLDPDSLAASAGTDSGVVSVEKPDRPDEEEAHLAGATLSRRRTKQDRAGHGAGIGAGLPELPSRPAYQGTDEFNLLENSAREDMLATQVQADPLMSKSSATVVQLVHRLLAAQRAAGMEETAVSFFSLVQRLTRAEAVKLFMQVLVTQTAGYTRASQPGAYGDIFIRGGRFMQA